MLCALFNSSLLFASPEPGFKRFTIGAIIALDAIRVDTAENRKGTTLLSTSMQKSCWLRTFRSPVSWYSVHLENDISVRSSAV